MSKKFCPMPFGSMHVDPNGDILVCCSDSGKMADTQGKQYNVQTHSLKEAWNSDHYKNLRQKFLRGEQPASCNQCWETELNDNSVSTRISSLNRFERFQKQGLDFDLSIDQAKTNQGKIDNLPVDFQVMSGNLCNLACKMCFPKYSNTWSKFYINRGVALKDLRLHNTMADPVDVYMNFGESFDWPKTVTMTNIFSEFKDNVYHINLTGGEPTLLEENIHFLDYLQQSKNIENLEIQIITNTTNINEKLLDSLKCFNRVILLSSIDGMDDIAYIQRTPSSWSQIYKNYCKILIFLKSNPHIMYGVNSTITALNIHHIHKLWDFLVEKSEYTINADMIGLNLVIPRAQSTGLEIVPRKAIDKIKKEFENTYSIKDSKVYHSMMSYFETIDWAENNTAMLELLGNIQKFHPELDIKKIYQIYYE